MNTTSSINHSRRQFLATLAATATATAWGREFGPEAAPVRYPDPDVVVLDERFAKYKIGNTPIQRLHCGTLWAEGPAWNAVGRYLIWSDIPNDVQLRWLEEDGHVSTFRNPAQNSNGNTFDWQGRQISCQHGSRRVVRYEHDGTVSVLAESWQGKPLNAPNDAVVHPDGGIWFTDPGYGSLMNYEGQRATTDSLQPYQKEAVYRIDAQSGKLEKVTDEIHKPNGLCFSPDYKKLYIADTGSSHYPEAPKNIKVWDVVNDRRLANGREFASMRLDRLRRGGVGRRNPRGRRRQYLGQRRLGRRGIRRRPCLCARRPTDWADSPARNLQQRLLRRHETQSAVHDSQPIAVRRLRRNPRCPHHVTVEPVRYVTCSARLRHGNRRVSGA